MSFENPKQQKVQQEKQEKAQRETNFATPKTNQPIEGLNSDTGGVPVLFKQQPENPGKKALEGVLNKARAERDRRQIEKELEKITTLGEFREYLHEKGVPSSEHKSREDEFVLIKYNIEQNARLKEKRAKREETFGQKLEEAMPTFSSWVKKGMGIVDHHLGSNSIGDELANSIQAAIQARKENYKKEGEKSDELRAKFTKEFESFMNSQKETSAKISADFKKAEELERNWIKAKKEKVNNQERPNQNPKLREYLALGLGSYIVALSSMITDNIEGVKSFEEFIQDTINPTPTLIDAIKEAERNDETTARKFNGLVRPAVITDNGNVYIPRIINPEEVSGDNTPEFRKRLVEEYLSCKNALPKQTTQEDVETLNKIMTNIENWFSKNPEITNNNQSTTLPNTGVYQNTPRDQSVPTKPDYQSQPFNPTPGQPVQPTTPKIEIPDVVRRTAE